MADPTYTAAFSFVVLFDICVQWLRMTVMLIIIDDDDDKDDDEDNDDDDDDA